MKLFTASIFLLFTLTASVAFADDYQLSSHILDITRGQPAPGVRIKLKKLGADKKWRTIETKVTDSNGRVKDFLPEEDDDDNDLDHRGIYKLVYYTAPYFKKYNQDTFYPFIEVVFEIKDNKHYHVPITLSAYGYSTYRGN